MIDVVIPVYRPDQKLEKLIRKLKCQTKKPSHIFFMQTLVDPDEDERVKDILSEAENGQIVAIQKNDYDHGGTRNQGAGLSEAEYVLFMTQDAVPVRDTLIEEMVDVLEKNEKVAVAYGRQLPNEQAGVIEKYTREFNYPAKSERKSKEDLDRLGIKTFFCSNVCAMYRRSMYENLGGFVTKTIFNEDMIFAAAVIREGLQIAYVAEAEVIHSHKYSYWQQLTRNFDLAVSQRQYREIFEQVKSESEGMRLVKDTLKYLLKQGKWYLVPDLIFQSGFKWIGYKLGLHYESLPAALVKKLSMNPGYWNERC